MGAVTPIFEDWQLFPLPMIGGFTARVRFDGLLNYERYFRSFVVIRPVYGLPEGVVRGPGRRFYPRVDSPEYIHAFPIPADLLARGWGLREFEIRKFLKRPYIGRSDEPAYNVTMAQYNFNELPDLITGGGEYG